MKRIVGNLAVLLIGIATGIVLMIYRCGYILENSRKRADKFFACFNILDRLLVRKEQNYQFGKFFRENHIQSVAIYGMGKIGKHLKYELEREGIGISYVIDEGESVIYGKDKHYNLEDCLPVADIVIVTPVYEYEEIKKRILANNDKLKVVSAEMVIGWEDAGKEKK